MKTKSIKQTIAFNCKPIEIYSLLMNSKTHAALTGGKASISKKINGKFSAFDGYCHGYNIELIEGEKIVQAWHFAEEGWPKDHYSICTFLFEQAKNGTKLTFHQTNIPEHKVEDLKNGWKEFYWQPIKSYFMKK